MNPMDISPDQFRHLSERITEIATAYLKDMDTRAIPAEGSGAAIERIFRTPLPETGLGEAAIDGLADVVRFSRAQNGRFFGYVLGSGEPVAAIADLLCSVLNQNVTAWRSSPAAVTIEHTVVSWLAQAVACQNFRGVLTGGGSSANLMALAMAREASAPANESGVRSGPALAVYASAEVHMSIPKAVALLGIGRQNSRLIPVDDSFRMIPEQLDQAMLRDKHLGITPVTVVATTGTVNTGAIDPLPQIAAIAAKYGAWLHVDGAYGALGAIAAAEKFQGLALADSISLDPHKWLYQPIDCGCLLYRDAAFAHRAFANSDDYVRSLTTDPIESFAFFEESIELSRRFRALKLWLSLRYHGFAALRKIHREGLATCPAAGWLDGQGAATAVAGARRAQRGVLSVHGQWRFVRGQAQSIELRHPAAHHRARPRVSLQRHAAFEILPARLRRKSPHHRFGYRQRSCRGPGGSARGSLTPIATPA
jgi:aromatic-L-amino-acid decarboxylase